MSFVKWSFSVVSGIASLEMVTSFSEREVLACSVEYPNSDMAAFSTAKRRSSIRLVMHSLSSIVTVKVAVAKFITILMAVLLFEMSALQK